MTLSELQFPRNPGTIGQDVPSRASTGLSDFTQSEFCGWATGSFGGRLKWAADPAGSSRIVTRWEVRYGDLAADRWGSDGQRVELWRDGFDQAEGSEAWFAWSWFLPADFKSPTGWCLFFQNFSQPDGSPPQALELKQMPLPNGTTVWQWVWCSRSAPSSPTYTPLGAATLGVWHHFLLYTKFSEGSAGLQKVWHTVGSPPDPASAPNISRAGNTLYHGLGHPALHIYRQSSSDSTRYPTVAFNGGFARAATAARAQQLAWPTATTPPPPPPPPVVTNQELVAAAKAELAQTTISYPKWKQQGFTRGHWDNTFKLLDQIDGA